MNAAKNTAHRRYLRQSIESGVLVPGAKSQPGLGALADQMVPVLNFGSGRTERERKRFANFMDQVWNKLPLRLKNDFTIRQKRKNK